VILATVTNSDAMQATMGGLAINGTMMVIGATPALQVPSLQLLLARQAVKGWYSGTSIRFTGYARVLCTDGVRSMNEVYPLEKAK